MAEVYFSKTWSILGYHDTLTYEESAVKLVVRVFKSGTVLYKTHAHVSLLNVTSLCFCLLIYSI